MRRFRVALLTVVALSVLITAVVAVYYLFPVVEPVAIVPAGTACFAVPKPRSGVCIVEVVENESKTNLWIETIEVNGVRLSTWSAESLTGGYISPMGGAFPFPTSPGQPWSFGLSAGNLTVGQRVTLIAIFNDSETASATVTAKLASG